MRPRVFPAEDRWESDGTPKGPAPASMRPRVFPAEDGRGHGRAREPAAASMRPRVFPAEDGIILQEFVDRGAGFNEAAGIPRGRRTCMPRRNSAGEHRLQ